MTIFHMRDIGDNADFKVLRRRGARTAADLFQLVDHAYISQGRGDRMIDRRVMSAGSRAGAAIPWQVVTANPG